MSSRIVSRLSADALFEIANKYAGRGMSTFRLECPEAYRDARFTGQLEMVRAVVGDARSNPANHAHKGGRPRLAVPTMRWGLTLQAEEYNVIREYSEMDGVSAREIVRRAVMYYDMRRREDPNFR